MRLNQNSSVLKYSLSLIVFELVRFLKVNLISGSICTFFSATLGMAPLIGAWGGFAGLGTFWAWNFMRSLFIYGLPLTFTAYHIPTICASAYWASHSWIIRVGIPVVCIGLFLAHPVGNQAFFYSFYWFIPLVLYYLKQESIFLTALGSTFVAHAVGSVIWLYTGSYTPAMFAALMPIVIIERILFATGMTLTYHIIDFTAQRLYSVADFFKRLSVRFI